MQQEPNYGYRVFQKKVCTCIFAISELPRCLEMWFCTFFNSPPCVEYRMNSGTFILGLEFETHKNFGEKKEWSTKKVGTKKLETQKYLNEKILAQKKLSEIIQGVSEKSVHLCFCNFSASKTPRKVVLYIFQQPYLCRIQK